MEAIIDDTIAINYKGNDKDHLTHILTSINLKPNRDLKLSDYVSLDAQKILISKSNLSLFKNLESKNVIGMDLNQLFHIYSGDKVYECTFLDSKFSFGSIAVLIKGAFGIALYTGYFCYYPDFCRSPFVKPLLLKENLLNYLYLDATYYELPSDFSGLEENIRKVVELIESFNSKKKIFIYAEKLTMDPIICELACRLKEKLYIDKNRMETMKLLGYEKYFTSDITKSRISVAKGYLQKKGKGSVQDLVIIFHRHDEYTDKFTPSGYNKAKKFYYFHFYCHSNHAECCRLIGELKPDHLIPIQPPVFDHSKVKFAQVPVISVGRNDLSLFSSNTKSFGTSMSNAKTVSTLKKSSKNLKRKLPASTHQNETCKKTPIIEATFSLKEAEPVREKLKIRDPTEINNYLNSKDYSEMFTKHNCDGQIIDYGNCSSSSISPDFLLPSSSKGFITINHDSSRSQQMKFIENSLVVTSSNLYGAIDTLPQFEEPRCILPQLGTISRAAPKSKKLNKPEPQSEIDHPMVSNSVKLLCKSIDDSLLPDTRGEIALVANNPSPFVASKNVTSLLQSNPKPKKYLITFPKRTSKESAQFKELKEILPQHEKFSEPLPQSFSTITEPQFEIDHRKVPNGIKLLCKRTDNSLHPVVEGNNDHIPNNSSPLVITKDITHLPQNVHKQKKNLITSPSGTSKESVPCSQTSSNFIDISTNSQNQKNAPSKISPEQPSLKKAHSYILKSNGSQVYSGSKKMYEFIKKVVPDLYPIAGLGQNINNKTNPLWANRPVYASQNTNLEKSQASPSLSITTKEQQKLPEASKTNVDIVEKSLPGGSNDKKDNEVNSGNDCSIPIDDLKNSNAVNTIKQGVEYKEESVVDYAFESQMEIDLRNDISRCSILSIPECNAASIDRALERIMNQPTESESSDIMPLLHEVCGILKVQNSEKKQAESKDNPISKTHSSTPKKCMLKKAYMLKKAKKCMLKKAYMLKKCNTIPYMIKNASQKLLPQQTLTLKKNNSQHSNTINNSIADIKNTISDSNNSVRSKYEVSDKWKVNDGSVTDDQDMSLVEREVHSTTTMQEFPSNLPRKELVFQHEMSNCFVELNREEINQHYFYSRLSNCYLPKWYGYTRLECHRRQDTKEMKYLGLVRKLGQNRKQKNLS